HPAIRMLVGEELYDATGGLWGLDPRHFLDPQGVRQARHVGDDAADHHVRGFGIEFERLHVVVSALGLEILAALSAGVAVCRRITGVPGIEDPGPARVGYRDHTVASEVPAARHVHKRPRELLLDFDAPGVKEPTHPQVG